MLAVDGDNRPSRSLSEADALASAVPSRMIVSINIYLLTHNWSLVYCRKQTSDGLAICRGFLKRTVALEADAADSRACERLQANWP